MKCPAVWKRCRAKKATRRTSAAVWHSSTSVPAASLRSGSDSREGALSVIGAVSPPGGDISEPVSQATLRIVKVFWGLDANLAYKRHFPAVNWLTSYSLYVDTMANWFNTNVAEDWMDLPCAFDAHFAGRAELEEIVKLGRYGRAFRA